MAIKLNHTSVNVRGLAPATPFYGFLSVDVAKEVTFDAIFARIQARGRGGYSEGPGGHVLEIITRPYEK